MWLLTFAGMFLYFCVRTAITVAFGMIFLSKSKWAKKRKIYRIEPTRKQLKSELKANFKVAVVDGFFISLIIQHGLIQFSPSTWANNILTFGVIFVWYEFAFYFIHRILHSKSLFFIHAQHHVALVAHPLSMMSFSVLDRVLLMAGFLIMPVLLSEYIPFSFGGFVAYGLCNLGFTLLGHLNVEIFPKTFSSSQMGRLLNTPTFHAMHHARFNGHYGLFTTILDRLFGSYYNDYPEIQNMASSGNGPKTLSFTVKKPFFSNVKISHPFGARTNA